MEASKINENAIILEECYRKFNLEIIDKKNESAGNDNYIEFYSYIFIDGAGQQKFKTKYYHEIDIIELCFLLNLDFDTSLREPIYHLLNCINLYRNESFWSLCGCCNEIEMRYATMMTERISKRYFERMIKKTIVLAKGFAPLILHQIASEEDPYQLAAEFFSNKKSLITGQLVATYDTNNADLVYVNAMYPN